VAEAPRVVIVDDNQDVVESMAALIRSAFPHIVVDGETNAEDLLQFARRRAGFRSIDLVIADHHMGAMSGLDLLVVLEREGLARRGVLISGDPKVEHYLRASGKSYGFLEKPIRPDVLLALVRREVGSA